MITFIYVSDREIAAKRAMLDETPWHNEISRRIGWEARDVQPPRRCVDRGAYMIQFDAPEPDGLLLP